jgi:hypothetical protein
MSDARIQLPEMPGDPTPLVHKSHSVQLYSDEQNLLDVASQFIGNALSSGTGAIVIATQSHQRQLDQKLSEQGLNPLKATAEGRYVAVDANHAMAQFMAEGKVNEILFTEMMSEPLARLQSVLNRDGSRIMVFGELVALLWAQGKDPEAVQVEQLWNKLAEKFSFSLLCAYPSAFAP